MTKKRTAEVDRQISEMDAEQLSVGKHELHGAGHFAGLYAGENVAGTEFVFGATFVILGASMVDVLIGLAVGNALAVLSYRFITAPIATRTRLGVYTYVDRTVGRLPNVLYNAVNAIIFAVVAAAMITVSATALRRVLGFQAQTEAYPTSWGFVALALVFGAITVVVAAYGFNALAEFASICGPWLMVMFATGGMVLLPNVVAHVSGSATLSSWHEFIDVGGSEIFTGRTPDGGQGIGLLGIIGYSWAANSFAHFGLVDTTLFRYAKKNWYGFMSGTGMFLGHYMAWVSAGFMGAAAAAITNTSITVIEPGEVALNALGYAGYLTVIIGGWTTANANLYRAGMAGQGVFQNLSRARVTLILGLIVLAASVFPFIYRGYLSFITYAGLILVPIGGVIFPEHYILPRLGLTRFWARYKGVQNTPALLAWGLAIALSGTAIALDLFPVYFAFLPAWAIAVIAYVVFARMAGAAKAYPEAEAEDEFFAQRVEVFHAKQAEETPSAADTKDGRPFTMVLKLGWILALVVVFADAAFVLLSDATSAEYVGQRNRFYTLTAVMTVIYFVLAYWELQRRKNFRRRAHVPRPVESAQLGDRRPPT